jgi:hypothetical protein
MKLRDMRRQRSTNLSAADGVRTHQELKFKYTTTGPIATKRDEFGNTVRYSLAKDRLRAVHRHLKSAEISLLPKIMVHMMLGEVSPHDAELHLRGRQLRQRTAAVLTQAA